MYTLGLIFNVFTLHYIFFGHINGYINLIKTKYLREENVSLSFHDRVKKLSFHQNKPAGPSPALSEQN